MREDTELEVCEGKTTQVKNAINGDPTADRIEPTN